MPVPLSRPFRQIALLGLVVSLLPSCALWRDTREPDQLARQEPRLAKADIAHVVVPEAFLTPSNPPDEVDSPTAWLTPEGGRWLISTGKKTHQLLVHDGETGALLRRVGEHGDAPGQFNRPNGIFAWGDRLFVVERDNRRVQVLSLPSFTPLATFGEAELRSPYGLWLHEPAGGELDLWVTDSFMDGTENDVVPPLPQLAERIKRYTVLIDGEAVSARFEGSLGDSTEAGALRMVESIAGDVANDRLLIAEEHVPTGTGYRVFGFDGSYTGRDVGVGDFGAQAEGIALWACDDGSGYWLAADQFRDDTLFHVIDRQTFETRGRFAGRRTGLTDGVWLSQAPSPRFPAGVFYASTRDEALSAFDWRDIARALNLRERCD